LGQTDGKNLVVLPKKPRNKQKLLTVEEEAERSAIRNASSSSGEGRGSAKMMARNAADGITGEEDPNAPSSEDEDEEDNQKSKKKKKKTRHVPWGPKEILEHLDDPQVVLDLDGTILPSLLKQADELEDKKKKTQTTEIIVWDHGKTPEGEKSDNNFFLWLESYSALRCNEKKEEENAAFQ
jgi:hypothetical protein